MAMSGGSDDGQPMMEMNTTPLIDVMLVLLIMFIITIPPITHAVDIDLPVPNDDPSDSDVDPVINKIVIEESNQILWNGSPVTLDQVTQYLKQTKSMEVEPELQFQPFPNANYDTVDKVLATIRRTEITKFGFVGNENYSTFGKANNAPN